MTESRPRPPLLRVPGWESIPHLVHGFYGRRGGVSRGAFAELNLSSRVGDDPEAVRQNWRRVASTMPGGMRVITMRQVHGAHVATVDEETADVGEADALMTCAAGTALSVLTADCVPLLLMAPRAHAVAAVHAGWRGALAGIAQRAVQQLETRFGVEPAEIHAALGPAIGGCCYEVDRSIVDALEERWGAPHGATHRGTGAKAMLDLRLANVAILERAGVQQSNIVQLGPCTKCAATDYFSYRAPNGPTGRQLSFIAWPGPRQSPPLSSRDWR